MDELCRQTLNAADIGIILVDHTLRILVWNQYIERLSAVKAKAAMNKRLDEVCTTFEQQRYSEMLSSVLQRQQCRFCSSKLHKAFIYPNNMYDETIRQNMSIMPLYSGEETYILIQIVDITYLVSSEHKLTSLLSELTKGYNDVRESEEINKRLAMTDPLTGLYNRSALENHLAGIYRKRANLGDYAMMFIDLDGFKRINDTLGHAMGDKLLVRVGEKITMSVRSEDMVARYGGDEFVVVIRSASGIGGAEIVARKLVEAIALPYAIEGKAVRITCSIGVTMFDGYSTSEEVIRRADLAMYQSKRNGKDRYSVYEPVQNT